MAKFFKTLVAVIALVAVNVITAEVAIAGSETSCKWHKQTKEWLCPGGVKYKAGTWNKAIRQVKHHKRNGKKYRCVRNGVSGWCKTRRVRK